MDTFRSFFLEQEVYQSYREYQYKHFILSNPPPPENCAVCMRQCGKICQSRRARRWQYGACALHAGYLRLQTHTHNM